MHAQQQFDGMAVNRMKRKNPTVCVCVMYETGTTASTPADDGSVGYWLGAKRARGSHDGTCMYDQWKWVDSYGRALSTVSGLTAFIPGKPDKYDRRDFV